MVQFKINRINVVKNESKLGDEKEKKTQVSRFEPPPQQITF